MKAGPVASGTAPPPPPHAPEPPVPPGLHTVAGLVMRQMERARHGVLVLALDGVGWEWAARTLRPSALRELRSTFPSTSVTAWLTAVTGAGIAEHAAVGAEFRVPARAYSAEGEETVRADSPGVLFDPAHGRVRTWSGEGTSADPAPVESETGAVCGTGVRTLFQRARSRGIPAYALCPELDGLNGPWTTALLDGALRVPHRPADFGRAPEAVAEAAVRGIGALLAAERRRPLLLWAYLDFDTWLHRHGPGPRLFRALRRLDEAAAGWAERGWTVTAHADHGLTPVTHDERARNAWAALDTPYRCVLPSGGAGRVRWLYPRPGTEERLLTEAREALAPYAEVRTPAELAARGLLPDPAHAPLAHARIGEVVALATGPAFPVPDPRCRWEHGARTEDELRVPLAVWSGTGTDTGLDPDPRTADAGTAGTSSTDARTTGTRATDARTTHEGEGP
ncbi:alkaline phosphatase family protein [Streptomyces sp. ODS28]|uniref:alkaline phosphatase family protein n=1 Tax=Streptomyces sp. ODS28 TaxID=3136688 RepID=UPI0031EE63E8